MTGLGGLKVPASRGVVALIALILSGCAETSPQSTSDLAVLPSGTSGAVVPIEPQPEFWPCGAEHPQPGRLVRFDPVDGTVAWDVDVPVQVETLAMSEGLLHLSDGVALDIVVDHATGTLTYPEDETDNRATYRAALPDGEVSTTRPPRPWHRTMRSSRSMVSSTRPGSTTSSWSSSSTPAPTAPESVRR